MPDQPSCPKKPFENWVSDSIREDWKIKQPDCILSNAHHEFPTTRSKQPKFNNTTILDLDLHHNNQPR